MANSRLGAPVTVCLNTQSLSLSQFISNDLAGHSEKYDCNDDLPINKR